MILADDFREYLECKYGESEIEFVMQDYPGHVELSYMTTDRTNGTYQEANAIIAEALEVSSEDIDDYLKNKGWTWHECGDGKIMRIVPREINQVFTHTGGIGIEKDKAALKESIARITENKRMVLDKFHVDRVFVDGKEAITERHKENKKVKKELFSQIL